MKYQKTTGWWLYVIKTPNNMYYSGYGGGKDGTEQPEKRWYPSGYKGTSLFPYIEQFGWENLEKIVLTDGLTREQALQWEDHLICMYTKLDCCINKQRSGGNRWSTGSKEVQEYNKQWCKDHKEERKEYQKQYYQDNKEELLEKQKQYYQDNKEELLEKSKEYHKNHREEYKQRCKQYYQNNKEELLKQQKHYNQEHKEERKQYNKQRYSTPEGKIYSRVCAFNHYHPDRIKETALEAKQKYLEMGYIPDYIKSDDILKEND